MPIATIAETIIRGDISVYLSANANAKGSLFGSKIAAPGSPVTIALITDALRWGYSNNGGAQTDADLREVANYLIWLIGMYGQQAQAIVDGGGTGGTVIPGAALPYPLDFIVSASSVIVTGASTITLSDFIGYNIEFNRNGQPQYTTDPGDGSTYFSWNRTTGEFALLNGAAQETERFRIVPIG